jgi:hypothetical protein
MPTGSQTVLATLAWLTDDAFDGDHDHSLLAQVDGLPEAAWEALPPNGGRTIGSILEHAGWAKWMYHDYAFGPGTLRGDAPPVSPPAGKSSRPPADLITWLKEGHQRWLTAIQALTSDTELDQKRLTNWGTWLTTRELIRVMISHDWYHAGEVNHLRALLEGTDRWPY